jgi:membrane associated rhomboid family serine protease
MQGSATFATMIKQGIAFAVLSAFLYSILIEPQDASPPIHFTSKRSSDSRTTICSLSIEAVARRAHISVDIQNPTSASFTVCVVPPGQKLQSYQRNRACGGKKEFQMQTEDHDIQGSVIVDDKVATLNWYSNATRAASGQYTVVWELHNVVSAANFDAVVTSSTFHDISAHLDGALYYPLQAITWLFNSVSNAYSFVRPASCRSAAKSSFNVNLVSGCKSWLGGIHSVLLLFCDVLSGGHIALALIVLLNMLALLPSIEDQDAWALHSGSPCLRSLITYQFAHANWQHIAGNMLTLLVVGTEVSESLNCDHILFVVFYLLCGVCGGLFAVGGSLSSRTRTVGASGSVSGLIVALSVLRPNAAVAILGDMNASHPLQLLVVTLLADFKRLGVSWQVGNKLFLNYF